MQPWEPNFVPMGATGASWQPTSAPVGAPGAQWEPNLVSLRPLAHHGDQIWWADGLPSEPNVMPMDATGAPWESYWGPWGPLGHRGTKLGFYERHWDSMGTKFGSYGACLSDTRPEFMTIMAFEIREPLPSNNVCGGVGTAL